MNKRYFNYNNPDNIQIFLDMDGVFSDFEGYFKEKLGKNTAEMSGNELWGYIGAQIKAGVPVFEQFKPYPHVKMIWEIFKKYDPIFLSSTGYSNHEEISKQKRLWLDAYIGKDVKAIFVKLSKKKAEYAYPNSILVDDREKSLKPFREAEGVGVLFDSKQVVNSMADFVKAYVGIRDEMAEKSA